MATSMAGIADVPPSSAAPAKGIREIHIKQALKAVQLPQSQPTVLRVAPTTPNVFQGAPKNLEHIPNGCARDSGSLCYDYRSGHAVFKPMRKLLPEIPGMTPHNLSIHHDKIVAQYTFK